MSDIKDFCTFCDPNVEDKKKIYYKTKNFTVWLSVGQIVEGYSLIIPNDHYNCIGALPKELQEEYLSLKSLIRNKITEIYGKCIFYEHGRAGYCHVQPGEELCYHAHMHALPVNANLKEKLFGNDELDEDGNPVIIYKNRASTMLKSILADINGQMVAGVGMLQFNTQLHAEDVARMSLWNARKFYGFSTIVSTLLSGASTTSGCGYKWHKFQKVKRKY